MYGSAADFTTYHEARGRTISEDWDIDVIEAALLVASEWVDNSFGDLFSGFPTDGYLQERQWPRTSAYTNTYPIYVFAVDEIPTDLENAVYEAAFREATSNGSLSVDFTPTKYKSVSIDSALRVEYLQNLDVHNSQKQIQIIDMLLSPLLDEKLDNSPLSGSSFRK